MPPTTPPGWNAQSAKKAAPKVDFYREFKLFRHKLIVSCDKFELRILAWSSVVAGMAVTGLLAKAFGHEALSASIGGVLMVLVAVFLGAVCYAVASESCTLKGPVEQVTEAIFDDAEEEAGK